MIYQFKSDYLEYINNVAKKFIEINEHCNVEVIWDGGLDVLYSDEPNLIFPTMQQIICEYNKDISKKYIVKNFLTYNEWFEKYHK